MTATLAAAAPLPGWAGPASFVAAVLVLAATSRGGGAHRR